MAKQVCVSILPSGTIFVEGRKIVHTGCYYSVSLSIIALSGPEKRG
jgi:hypothetical protein